jgi:hypothetical protein
MGLYFFHCSSLLFIHYIVIVFTLTAAGSMINVMFTLSSLTTYCDMTAESENS